MAKIKQDIQNINTLCKLFNVKALFITEKIDKFPENWAGTFIDQSILFNAKNKIDYLSVFFHELAHILKIRSGSMKFFHNFNFNKAKRIEKIKFKKIFLKSEREIDILAASLMRSFFPKRKFYGYYL